MKEWRKLYAMTRRERQGTIVLLLIIAVLIACSHFARTHRSVSPVGEDTTVVDVRTFEAAADSVTFTVDKVKPVKPSGKRQSSKRRAAKKGKPSPPPQRRLDPVPQF